MGRLHTVRDERGMSLVELVVAMSVLIIVAPMITSVMVSTLQAGRATEEQSRVVDELRQQMYAVSRELRSARCIKIPTSVNTPGDTLRFTTESQTGLSSSTSDIKYHIDGTTKYLVRTQYDVNGLVTGTRLVGPGLINPNTTFEMKETPRKRVIVKLQLQLSTNRPVQELTTTIAGRNAWPDLLTC